jgi:orotate phosphoribosyltransferase-like protein
MNQQPTAEPSLIDTARKLYAENGAGLSNGEIARRMNVSKEWVRRFIAGEIPNPGVLTLESFIAVIKAASNV